MNIADQQPTLRVKTRPNDANATGDIFGGWLMSQIDIAGAVIAAEFSSGPVVTVAVKELLFLKPIFVYDIVSFYGEVISSGKTSITVKVDVYAERRDFAKKLPLEKVSDATLVFVAVSAPGVKRLLT